MTEQAIENAAAWWPSIKEMLDDLSHASTVGDKRATEACQNHIQESALSVDVRDGWHAPGWRADHEEYRILLTWGGPALRIYGKLDRYNEPDSDPMLQWRGLGNAVDRLVSR